MNAIQAVRESRRALKEYPTWQYHLNQIKTARYVIKAGTPAAELVDQYHSGTCIWKSADGTTTAISPRNLDINGEPLNKEDE